MRLLIILLLALYAMSCAPSKEEKEKPNPFEGLSQSWNAIKPGGKTTCSYGTEFTFYFRPGDPEKLVVFFQGGGACWNLENCDHTKKPTFDPTVDDEDNPSLKQTDELGRDWNGIFDQNNNENPVADYSFLFIPYCTGDVHLGSNNVDYSDSLMVKHQGYANVMAALNWAYELIEEPESVFVTGESAGSLASIIYAMSLYKQYPEADIVQLGDASAAYESDGITNTLSKWSSREVVAEIMGVPADSVGMNFEDFSVMTANKIPNGRFSVYNAESDEVQGFFLQLLGEADFEVKDKLKRNLDKVTARTKNFHYYTDSGVHHTILSRKLFYQSEVNGKKLSAWVGDLINNKEINNLWYE